MSAPPSLVRRPTRGQPSSALASFLLVLTLGVGIAEAFHAEEHAEEGSCVDCMLCHAATHGPVSGPAAAPEPALPNCASRLADLSESATHVAAERRPDDARAPPA